VHDPLIGSIFLVQRTMVPTGDATAGRPQAAGRWQIKE
jgi:hypothetical protein